LDPPTVNQEMNFHGQKLNICVTQVSMKMKFTGKSLMTNTQHRFAELGCCLG